VPKDKIFSMTVRDVLDEIRKVKSIYIIRTKSEKRYRGWYLDDEDAIYLNLPLINNADELVWTFLHELFHRLVAKGNVTLKKGKRSKNSEDEIEEKNADRFAAKFSKNKDIYIACLKKIIKHML